MSIALSASPYFPSPTVTPPGVSSSTRPSVSSVDPQAQDESAGRKSSNPTERATENGESREVNGQTLDESELAELKELKARDREVRAHEAAHQSVGGQHAGSVSYTYSRGPDGVQYATGGEVSIDVSPVANDPQATIDKMRVVRSAALAPAEPSSQDRQVAAEAMQTMLQAQAEIAAERKSGSQKSEGDSDASDDNDPQIRRQGQQAEAIYQGIASLSQSDNSARFQASA